MEIKTENEALEIYLKSGENLKQPARDGVRRCLDGWLITNGVGESEEDVLAFVHETAGLLEQPARRFRLEQYIYSDDGLVLSLTDGLRDPEPGELEKIRKLPHRVVEFSGWGADINGKELPEKQFYAVCPDVVSGESLSGAVGETDAGWGVLEELWEEQDFEVSRSDCDFEVSIFC